MNVRQNFKMNFRPFMSSNVMLLMGKDIEIPKNYLPDECYLIRALLYRRERNMNSFVLTVGDPRTSKSYFYLKIADRISEILGIEFNVEKQLTFDDIEKFLRWSMTDGVIFNLDETGTSLSPEQFWQLSQHIMRRYVQTQGFRLKILFWTLPSIAFLQKRFRFLSNYAVKTVRQGLVNIFKIEVDQLLGKGYPSYRETIHFELPSKEVREVYEKMKKEWNDKILLDDIEFLRMMRESKCNHEFIELDGNLICNWCGKLKS